MKILFIDGTSGFSPTRLDSRPTGGILTSLTLIPRYLASKGFDVTVIVLRLGERPCQAKVRYFYLTGRVYKEVGWFEVAVDKFP